MSNQTTIYDVLRNYRSSYKSTRDMGTAFERLIKAFLLADPQYASRFANVWMWSEWPQKWGPDCGIDLIALTHGGDYTAVQCKFYDESYQIEKSDIDSFFTESGRKFKVDGVNKKFTHRLIVSTTSLWTENADRSIRDQEIETQRIGLTDLANSPIDWSKFDLKKPETLVFREKKKLRPHQIEAIEKVTAGFKSHDRGKLIMACGTGKTFTALRLAEQYTSSKGIVLFLVPSISLLSQTLREWTAEADSGLMAYAVCSDGKVGKSEDMSRSDLAFPASTDAASLAREVNARDKTKGMTVVFATYQSIKVVSDAQKNGAPNFDLIICDEAHRTTGVTLSGEDESHFVKVHDETFIKGRKRLYMTATPRLYGESAKAKASEAGAELCSMDDQDLYGPELHKLGFGDAVARDLLTDYKVLVLAVDERHISQKFQQKLTNDDGEIPLDDVVKIIGCWNGLAKQFGGDDHHSDDRQPMARAVAFVQKIIDSKRVEKLFQDIVTEYIDKSPELTDSILKCEVQHVDGKFNVLERNKRLAWLKESAPQNTCRILSNARCLSEGVDVPALDAVLFLNPRDSQVDVVQSVGRVMRRAEGKKYGYVILPIGVPAGIPPEEALKDNKKYKVVWQVLQALRSHDDRFDALINKIDLNKDRPDQVSIIGVGGGSDDENSSSGKSQSKNQTKGFFFPELDEWKDAIYAKMVLKCGSRVYWEQWAGDVAKIASENISQIRSVLKSKDSSIRNEFERFFVAMKRSLNSSVTEEDAIEMLAQHLVTKPIFDALFEHYEFTKHNPVSLAMQGVLKGLEAEMLQKDALKLKSFYESVRMRVRGIDNAEGRQRVIVELYEKFFRKAFKKDSDRLGIVYTPNEVVDFIIKSVESVMKNHFKMSLSDKDVHLLDPFTGTGTFIVRLLQSGLIRPEDLKRKFTSELHANEIVLLAYYIAAINIEETYHSLAEGQYEPFKGIVLTDTFESKETGKKSESIGSLSENDQRLASQQKARINVIVGNPPYSAGQNDSNENNQNLKYNTLDFRIRETYGIESISGNKNSLYDAYIRAIRWSTDRINDFGVVGFVTNAGFLDSNSADGLRKVLGKEFAKIYCFNLRGNARTQGEQRRKEKGNVFGEGSKTPVGITIFVKDPRHKGDCAIYYHDIGDYLSREEKLARIQKFASIDGIYDWRKITPNAQGDWISHRDSDFDGFLKLIDKDSSKSALFLVSSAGSQSNRDFWVYNFSTKILKRNIRNMIEFYNSEIERWRRSHPASSEIESAEVADFVNNDPLNIAWTRGLKNRFRKMNSLRVSEEALRQSIYRPFTRTNLHFQKHIVEYLCQWPVVFPTANHGNVVITVTGVGVSKEFSCLISNAIPDVHYLANGQCFPLWYYDHIDDIEDSDRKSAMKVVDKYGFVKQSAISSDSLIQFQVAYEDSQITAEDLFYYIYGVLHSPIYRERFQTDLKKMLPRIPFLKDFWGYSRAGRELAEWHLNYESVKPYRLIEEISGADKDIKNLFTVTKMTHPKNGKDADRSVILYNSRVKITGIPLEAYEYVVNGKAALDWIMDRYKVTVDKDSGIKNDPNDWSDDPRYIIDLIGRIVTVSLETNRIVNNLPEFEVLEAKV